MGFPFSLLCDLLDTLDNNYIKSSNIDKIQQLNERTITAWYKEHDEIIPRKGPAATAFLSCLFPERRPDRVFGLGETRLEAIIKMAQGLGSSRMKEMKTLKTKMDFASSVKSVMSATDNGRRPRPNKTLEEINEILDRIAATSSFSSPNLSKRVREKHGESINTKELLSTLFRVFHSSEAKWMIRMISKDYSPVHLPETLAMQQFHFLLPDILTFHRSLEVAVEFLGEPVISSMPHEAAEGDEGRLRASADCELKVQVGAMVTRPALKKARSIRHCCQLMGRNQMSVEQKYDGEYCQIHIDMNNPINWITIFSKSGKDSTMDRIKLHPLLREGMQLDTKDCKIKRQCILEGEMLVWNDKKGRIEPFHKIRKHVRRSGRLIGTSRDSPVEEHEHLMIMLYDVLLLDDTVCIRESHAKRRQILQSLGHYMPGRVEIGTSHLIDFSHRDAPDSLREMFAHAIANRWEGFVLKGCNDPYFSFNRPKSFIKLKKDYIPGLGDTADLAIVGGRYDAKDAQEIGNEKLRWTSFFIGCLENKDEVCRFKAKPSFHIIDVVDRHGISKDNISYLSIHGNFEQVPFPTNLPDFDVKIEAKHLRPTELFSHPFVVELMGAGFDKPANADYYTLRFPRVLKIHEDRSFEETISFKELQEMAKTCTELPEDGETEEAHWLKMLGGLEYQAGISSPYTASDDSDIASLTEIANDDSDEEKANKRVRKRAMASEDLPTHGVGSKRFKRRSN